MRAKFLVILILCTSVTSIKAEDGYKLWLRYNLISDAKLLEEYKKLITGINFEGNSPIINAAKEELNCGLKGLFGENINYVSNSTDGLLIIGTPDKSTLIASS